MSGPIEKGRSPRDHDQLAESIMNESAPETHESRDIEMEIVKDETGDEPARRIPPEEASEAGPPPSATATSPMERMSGPSSAGGELSAFGISKATTGFLQMATPKGAAVGSFKHGTIVGDHISASGIPNDTASLQQMPASTGSPISRSNLGNLHKRRASASPEKFNTGQFEPSPLRIVSTTAEGPPTKKARLENKVEISYDETGTPRISSITPSFALPSGRRIAASHILNPKRSAAANRSFSILDAFMRQNDLLLLVVSYLTIPSLISLYAISKPFHCILNRHHTAFILSIMRTWSPNADKIFPWRCYKPICVKDPIQRQKSSMVGKDINQKHEDLRDVPSLRWLQMVVWRHGVCKDLLIQLAIKGLRCPCGTLDAIKRMWFILDLPLNSQRIALCRSEAYLTNQVIYNSTLFFLKVDMVFTEPSGAVYPVAGPHTNIGAYPRRWESCGFVGCDLRELLLAERNLTPLWRVLRGWSPDSTAGTRSLNRLDVLKLWVRHQYSLPEEVPEHIRRQSILGIPWYEVGTAGLERTGVATVQLSNGKKMTITNPAIATHENEKLHKTQQMLYPHQKHIIVPKQKAREQLLRPEELMMREAIRRKMSLHRQWSQMMLWGFCDTLGRNLPLRTELELIAWSNGKEPLSHFKTDAEAREALEEKKRMETDASLLALSGAEGVDTAKGESRDDGEFRMPNTANAFTPVPSAQA